MALAAVRDLREQRAPASAKELVEFETDVRPGFMLARAAGLVERTIRTDTNHMELVCGVVRPTVVGDATT